MDWNWFFSSLAQSDAAIVGLFGAFIITKIINNEQNFNLNKQKIEFFLTLALKYKNKYSNFINKRIKTFNKYVAIIILSEIYNKIQKGQISLIPNYDEIEKCIDESSNKNYVRYMTKNNLINEIISFFQENKTEDIKIVKKDRYIELKTSKSYEGMFSPYTVLYSDLNNLKEEIEKCGLETENSINEMNYFLKFIKRNPESTSLITVSIILVWILFCIGVIFPLLLLPTSPEISSLDMLIKSFSHNEFSKIKFIFIFSVMSIFTGIFGYFLFKNLNMRYSTDDKKELEYYSKLENYSDYLNIME